MELQRAHDRVRPARRTKRVLSSTRRTTAPQQTVSAPRCDLEKLLQELAKVIEAEPGVLIR